MKKSFILIISFFSVFSLYSQSKDFGRWSFMPEYGYNMFDGDINQNLSTVFPTSIRDITFGGSLEYALTPVWGLSLDYFYFPLKASNTIPLVNIDTKLHTGDFNATINFTRWIFPETHSKFYVNGTIGVGFAQYYTNPINPLSGKAPTDSLINENGEKIFRAGSVPVTFSLEYNMFKPLAIGFRVHYRAYTKDNLEGISHLNWKGVTNDYIASGSVYLRLKFASSKQKHLRDATWQEYQPSAGLLEARDAKRQIAALGKKVDVVDQKVNNIELDIDTLNNRVTNIENKVNTYDMSIQNIQIFMTNNGPDTDNDGVPDVRDKEPNTPVNTEVDFWGKTIKHEPNPVKIQTNVGVDVYNDLIPAVYFDFDRTDLDNQALETISKVALKMRSDSTLLVEVRGYCDYMGKDNYNKKLSIRRAERVKQELVNVWKVDPRRINSNGNGRIITPPIKYRPNRRCDFYFSK